MKSIDIIQDSEYCHLMVDYDALMSRVGKATMRLARKLSDFSEGDRIPPVAKLAEELECGIGTAKAALGMLEDAHAIKLHTRGHKGTYLKSVNQAILWELSGQRIFSIAMPLPYSRRYEAHATGLTVAFQEAGIPLSLVFMRGASSRLQALKDGRVDLALISGLACDLHPEFPIVCDFGIYSYVGAHGIVKRSDVSLEDEDLRVGVDPLSIDQVALVRRAFPNVSAENLVECSYTYVVDQLRDGQFDATVWNLDQIEGRDAPDIEIVPLEILEDFNTHAVAVAANEEAASSISRVVRDTLKSDVVDEVGSEVAAGERIPTY